MRPALLLVALVIACVQCVFGASYGAKHDALLAKMTAKKQLLERVASTDSPTLSQLLALKSQFNPLLPSNTTVILNHWKRDSLRTQLQTLAEMSVMPEQIWVCMFNSPEEQQYLQIIEEAQALFPPNTLHPVTSPVNFKYYGRFQLALQARTKYVWIFDDDVLPGSRFLELMLHTIQTEDFRGLLGTIGWIMPALRPDGSYADYRDSGLQGGLMVPDAKYDIQLPNIQKVDLLCSMWFLEREWVHYLFTELPPSPPAYETGEDFMLSYQLRKYGNIETYVLPISQDKVDFMGNVDQMRLMAQSHATTDDKMVKLRNSLFHRNVQHGGKYMLTRDRPRNQATFMVYIDPLVDPLVYQELLKPVLHKPQNTEVMYLLAGDDSLENCPKLLSVISPSVPVAKREKLCVGGVYGLFDLNINSLPSTRIGMHDVVVHTSKNLQAILENAQPDYMIMISQGARGAKHQKLNTGRRYATRNLDIGHPSDKEVILSAVGHIVSEVTDRMKVPRLEIYANDVPVASKVLAVNPSDVKGILYCRPPVAALLHAGPRIAQQLSELQGLTMFGQKVHAVVLVGDASANDAPEASSLTQGKTGWPASALAVVPTPHPVTVQDRAVVSAVKPNLRGSGFILPFMASGDPNAHAELLLGFLAAVQSYALASPDQYVLYVSHGVDEITPQVLLYLSVSAHILRKQFMASSSQYWGTSCEDLEADMYEDDNPKYQQAYFNELWYIPARGVAQGRMSGDTEQLLNSAIGSALSAERMDFTQMWAHGFSGLYPAHTWIALQFGLDQALKDHGFADLSAVSFEADEKSSDTVSVETIGRTMLRHAQQALTDEPCDGEDCSVLSVGLPLRSKLFGGNPIGMSWFRRLVTVDSTTHELSIDDILSLMDEV